MELREQIDLRKLRELMKMRELRKMREMRELRGLMELRELMELRQCPELSQDSKAPKEGAMPRDTGMVTQLQGGTDKATTCPTAPTAPGHCPHTWDTCGWHRQDDNDGRRGPARAHQQCCAAGHEATCPAMSTASPGLLQSPGCSHCHTQGCSFRDQSLGPGWGMHKHQHEQEPALPPQPQAALAPLPWLWQSQDHPGHHPAEPAPQGAPQPLSSVVITGQKCLFTFHVCPGTAAMEGRKSNGLRTGARGPVGWQGPSLLLSTPTARSKPFSLIPLP